MSNKPRRVRRLIEVTRVKELSPRMVRVTFTGDNLAEFGWNGPAAHIKLIFPEKGQTEPAPQQEGGPRPTMRTYTPRRFDPAVPELDVEFVLHGHGPASTWAAQAKPGQRLMVAGPGPNYVIDPNADWHLLAADETALPAISTILDVLPAGKPVIALVEAISDQDERPLETAANLELRWLHRGDDVAQSGIPLEKAIQELEFPEGVGQIYVGCESNAMRRIRQHLLKERGYDKTRIVTRGYWKLGATDHPDRDFGDDA
ncbi:MAG: siderophore-interacting protein [Chloroflexota bacterium]